MSGAVSKTFTYGNTTWLDLLTSYNGNSITYDTVGNPTSYYNGASMTWQRGRQMSSYTNGSSTSSYLYNADGIRTRKIVNGTKHDFVYVNGLLTADLTNTNKLIFSYDDQGHPATLKYNNDVYYYVINQQGDVLALRDASNNVVASYSYNAWGELLSSSGSMANTNPLRYRGYYYDTETGFYYLQSRYYDPVICRFINADGYVSTGQDFIGFNMFAYCNNNPVCFRDYNGNIPFRSFNVNMTDTGSGNSGAYAQYMIDTYDTSILYAVYYYLTEWHFERRAARNGVHPTHEEVMMDRNWELVPESHSIYHDNGVGKPEEKYINQDGREAVFDGDTLLPITDPRYIATYNYVTPHMIPSDGATIWDYAQFVLYGIGHFFCDMLPYYLTGKSNTRTQFEGRFTK